MLRSERSERLEAWATGRVLVATLRDARCARSSELMNVSAKSLPTHLTLRNGAKRSVSKGGDAHPAWHRRSAACRRRLQIRQAFFALPPFETLRFAPFLRAREEFGDLTEFVGFRAYIMI